MQIYEQIKEIMIEKYSPILKKKQSHLADLEKQIASEGFYNDQRKSSLVMKDYHQTQKLLEDWQVLQNIQTQIKENQDLAKEDEDLASIAKEELPALEKNLENLIQKIEYGLLPKDPNEEKNALLEIRAGTGGDEASLFAGELMQMYERFSEKKSWQTEYLSSSPSEVGGYKEIVLKISGDEVFRHLQYESGVHRVQRVPSTETQGRIHTSTVTVAVLPEAEEVDVEIRSQDLRVEVCRASGSGGQCVNTTDSAVQIFHLPTGLMVRCEQERSQTQNKERAMEILRTKLFEQKQTEQNEQYSSHRRSLIGTGDRSEKIRTYNFPQSRITDHRIHYTIHSLEEFINGDLEEMIAELQKVDMEKRLQEASLADDSTKTK